ncbi:hypothetical protein AALO_G00158090 [Alosa alosa]|uniref:Proline rich 33 n=1 Tax=Alosa alosa TaxID=278164 RepID=A0AAV6GGS5_9TELE|nr:hypothetical protein AALO_G00158090 [Alosa alosa]
MGGWAVRQGEHWIADPEAAGDWEREGGQEGCLLGQAGATGSPASSSLTHRRLKTKVSKVCHLSSYTIIIWSVVPHESPTLDRIAGVLTYRTVKAQGTSSLSLQTRTKDTGADFLRAMSYGAVFSPGLLSQQYPPPLLPKPGKDNARLQKLLKKSAKKKAAQQSQQIPLPFRSSLSPVNEASPDLERSDHSTPPRTPETPTYATLHPRFSVRPLYQHVASPYPHHRGFTYGKTARFSPQPYGAPSQPAARAVTPRITYTPPLRPAGVSPGPEYEGRRSKTPTLLSVSGELSQKPLETEPPKPQEAKKSPALLPKTKPVPVVERAKPQATEAKQAKSPATSTVPKASVTETPKGKAAIAVPPKPKTPTPGVKIPPAQKQIAAQSTKSKTSEKDSDEPKKQDVKSKILKEQSKVSTKPAVPKDSALGTLTVKASGTQSISSILSPKPKISEPPKADKCGAQPVTKPKEKPADEEKNIKEVKTESKAGEPTLTKTSEEKMEKESAFPKAEPLLKVVKKPKGMMKSKLSGWSRLKKHMVVEVEEPKFPEQPPASATEPKKEIPNGELPKLIMKKKDEDEASSSSQPSEGKDSPRATKMWDAVLFQMFSTKENIMQQIMADKSEEEKKELEKQVATKPEEIPAFAHRLPVLLFSPRFDAKRLREAASRPVTKMSTVFEMALIGRHVKDEEPKQFNRTAKGFNASNPTEA